MLVVLQRAATSCDRRKVLIRRRQLLLFLGKLHLDFSRVGGAACSLTGAPFAQPRDSWQGQRRRVVAGGMLLRRCRSGQGTGVVVEAALLGRPRPHRRLTDIGGVCCWRCGDDFDFLIFCRLIGRFLWLYRTNT